MSTSLDPTQGLENIGRKARSFWSRPEGKTGLLITAGLVFAGFFGLKALLPLLTSFFTDLSAMFSQAIAAGLYGLALFALIYVVFIEKRFRTLGFVLLKAVSRMITGIFIDLFPEDILKGQQKRLSERLSELVENRRKLKAGLDALQSTIREYAGLMKEALAMMEEARRQNKTDQAQLQGREAARLKNDIDQFQALLQVMLRVDQILGKLEKVCRFWVQDISSQIDMTIRKRKLMESAHGALKASLGVIRGGSDEDELFNETMERLAEDYDMKMGEINSIFDAYGNFMSSIDIRTGMYERTAVEQLDAWSQKADAILASTSAAGLLTAGTDTLTIDDIIDVTPERDPVPARLPGRRTDDKLANKLLGDDES